MTTTPAYGAVSATAQLQPLTIQRRELGPRDVRVAIDFCGICHSDIHTVRGEWGPQQYPLVPGHEITGRVAQVGHEVSKHRVGDRVGVGTLVGSCGACGNCAGGHEQYCVEGPIDTYAATDRDGTRTQGGYATGIVVDEDFVLKIPDGLSLEAAAPLLCAGVTTWSPLRHWRAGPGTRVAVVGLGGLGHMGVKLAHALGAEVTVLSRTPAKRETALALGADAYYATSDPSTFTELAGSFDLILNTVSARLDLEALVDLLATDGALVSLGWPSEPMGIRVGPLISQRRSLTGSLTGGIAETQQMLDFCAEHGVVPEIEVISAYEINDAWERMLAADVRYRFVIDISTLR